MSPAIRVALLAPGYPPDAGGVEDVVGHLAAELRGQGHDVEVFTHHLRSTDSSLPTTADHAATDQHSTHRYRNWTGTAAYPVAPTLGRDLRHRLARFDVVHAHNLHSTIPLWTLLAQSKPTVVTCHYHGSGHTPFAKGLHWAYRPIQRQVLARTDALVTVSNAEREQLLRDWPKLPPGRVHVIRNGIDTVGILAAEPFAARSHPVILTGGRLEPYKQVDAVLRGAALLPFPATIVVTGSGPALSELRRLASTLPSHIEVDFLGHIPVLELRRWQRSADVFISMSRHEAFGLAVAEAACAGARIAVSRIPAHTEVCEQLTGGVAVIEPDASASQIAAALEVCLRSDERPDRTQWPTWDEVATAYVDLYASLLRPTP